MLLVMMYKTISFLLLLPLMQQQVLCKSSDESQTSSPASHSISTTTIQSIPQSILSPASSITTSLNIKCDRLHYYGTGCPDHQTTICDPKRLECVCRAGAIVIEGRCMTIKSIDEPCYSSKECETTSGAKCINAFGELESPSTRSASNKAQDVESAAGQLANTANIFFNMHAGYCQCPTGFYHHQEKGKCMKRLIGSKCQNNTECFAKQHSICDQDQSRCICDVGFIPDSQSDQCKPSAGTTAVTAVDARHMTPRATPFCEYGLIWDQGIRKCVPLIHWENNRTWSALVWKVAVLCIVLVLLMMLASGIQRARQNENLLNWSRALELYAARGPGATGSTIDLEAAAGGRANGSSNRISGASGLLDAAGIISRDGVVLVLPSGMPPPPPSYTAVAVPSATDTSLVTTIVPIEAPPSYEEAVRSASIHRLRSDHHAITSSTTSLTSSNSANIIDAVK